MNFSLFGSQTMRLTSITGVMKRRLLAKGESSGDTGLQSTLSAGLPTPVPSWTVNLKWSALTQGVQRSASGDESVITPPANATKQVTTVDAVSATAVADLTASARWGGPASLDHTNCHASAAGHVNITKFDLECN